MKPGPGRRWLVGAVALFLGLFVLWILAVFQLSPASAGAGALQLRLRSNLAADYTAAPMMRMLRTLRLTVMEDVMRDMGMTDEEASAEMRAMAALLESPVPTATARSLMGEAPFTPTSTKTSVPTDTLEPTATSTRRPPPTPTEKPTKKPKTATPAGPTATAAGADSVNPSFQSIVLAPPPPDNMGLCSINVTVDVFDPAFSSGIAAGDVYTRISINSGPWVNYEDLDWVSGGFVSGPGSDWLATYADSADLSGAHAGDSVEIEVKVKDIAHRFWVIVPAGTYTMGCDC